MGLWQRIRTEARGALRSVRYDMRRTEVMYPEYDAYCRQPHRVLMSGGIVMLAVGGVAVTYFALAGGLGGLILGSPSTPTERPAPPIGINTPSPTPDRTQPHLVMPVQIGTEAASEPGASPSPSPSPQVSTSSPDSGSPSPQPSPSPSPQPSLSPSASPSESPSPQPSGPPSSSTMPPSPIVSTTGADGA